MFALPCNHSVSPVVLLLPAARELPLFLKRILKALDTALKKYFPLESK